MFLFFQTEQAISLIQTLGFPTALAIAMLFFGWKVWQKQNAKIDEKDKLIEHQTESRKEFNEKLLDSQNRINATLTQVACINRNNSVTQISERGT